MRLPLHFAIVLALAAGPVLARPAAAQVAVSPPTLSPRAMTRAAPPVGSPTPAAQIGTLMTLAQAQPQAAPPAPGPSASVRTETTPPARLEPEHPNHRRGF